MLVRRLEVQLGFLLIRRKDVRVVEGLASDRTASIGESPGHVLDEIRPLASENVPQAWRKSFPVPRVDGHKYARGHTLVVSGDMASTGDD